ncbi:Ly-6-related family-containing protein [Aphelenchoides fujianensis]|nr:Ly-6-related family-containing protein [Aphelenchoides fujianensis]
MATDFLQLFSYILANVSDQSFPHAYRMQCYSCMSPYLEDQFVFISHLYRKPLSFTDKCDRNNFDWQALQPKNCSDLCVTLRMNDKVGGRRRNGYMRGCMSDIKFYNRSVLYYGDAMRGGGGSTHQTRCQLVRLRDLFAAPDWYGFDPNDHVELCTCHAPFCNSAHSPLGQSMWLVVAGVLGTTLMFDWIFPTRRKP